MKEILYYDDKGTGKWCPMLHLREGMELLLFFSIHSL